MPSPSCLGAERRVDRKMMRGATVTVLMPVLEAHQFVYDVIESILAQTFGEGLNGHEVMGMQEPSDLERIA